jgi:RNA polymerase sigma factor (sigma-70 family)
MLSGQLAPVIRFLRTLKPGGEAGEAADRELLERWAAVRDGDAFAALVGRHGPMVFGVCRRVLRNAHDAEDAFQATFLVLARRAGSVSRPELLGNWLYGVAYRTALKARAGSRRRRSREVPMLDDAPAPARDADGEELGGVLDEEVGRLPGRYRAAFVLCYLEGRTNEEAARLLGCPKGTVLSRLAWARDRLRYRLTRRGLTLAAGLPAAFISAGGAEAAVPAALARVTVQTVLGQATASAEVAALAKGVVQSMLVSKYKFVSALVLAVGIVAGAGLFGYHRLAALPAGKEPVLVVGEPAAEDDQPAAEDAPPSGNTVRGSGKLVTRQFKLAGFTSVDVRQVFDVEVTRGETFSVSVTADDNLFDYVKAAKEGEALQLSLDTAHRSLQNGTFKAAVTMPDLRKVSLGGACKMTLKGFTAGKDFGATVSGASTLGGEIKAARVDLHAVGASTVRLRGAATSAKLEAVGASHLQLADLTLDGADRVDLHAIGASTVRLRGAARAAKLEAEGACHLQLADLTVDRADVRLTGASGAKVRVKSKLDYRLSGASHLSYAGDPTVGRKEVTGASSASR